MRDLAKFWDNVADGYARRPVPDESVYQRKLAMTREYLTSESRVLEFGCGTGSTALTHAPHVAHIVATDVSAAMIDIGREKAALADIDNVSFRQAGVEDFEAPDSSYDMVLALNLIHLLEDRAAAIAKIHRVLKPGGTLRMFEHTGSRFYPFRLFMNVMTPLTRLVGPDMNRPTVANVVAAGFEILEVGYVYLDVVKTIVACRPPAGSAV